MITPTVGRKMWYRPQGNLSPGQVQHDKTTPFDATVVYVWGPEMVNLLIADHNGNIEARTSVPIVQEGGSWRAGESPYCEWMPYQTGQG